MTVNANLVPSTHPLYIKERKKEKKGLYPNWQDAHLQNVIKNTYSITSKVKKLTFHPEKSCVISLKAKYIHTRVPSTKVTAQSNYSYARRKLREQRAETDMMTTVSR